LVNIGRWATADCQFDDCRRFGGTAHAFVDGMKPPELRARTYAFGLAVVNLCKALPDTLESRRVRAQLTDSGTSVPANYRAACRARSRAEFIAKIGTCCEEADESEMWLQMCADAGWTSRATVAPLVDEAGQLLKIFTASLLTAKRRNR
jgi:four helix bundle protein